MYVEQIRAARALLGMKQSELAERAGVSLPTIKRIESSQAPVFTSAKVIQAIIGAFAELKIDFTESETGDFGVSLRTAGDEAGKSTTKNSVEYKSVAIEAKSVKSKNYFSQKIIYNKIHENDKQAINREAKEETTQRGRALNTLNAAIPWSILVQEVESHEECMKVLTRSGVSVETMIRIYCLQKWFNLSEATVVEAISDSLAIRKFLDINSSYPNISKENISEFHDILQGAGVANHIDTVEEIYLKRCGLKLRKGSIVEVYLEVIVKD